MKASETVRSVANAYGKLVASGEIEDDRAQRELVGLLDNLIADLSGRRQSRKSGALGWLFSRRQARQSSLQGLYVYGAVGRGKSMLMDLMFDLVAQPKKRRLHFNDFMADVHERLAGQRAAFAAGKTRETDPVKPIGRSLSQQSALLCIDEFSISDIADAMIVGRLFAVLFSHGTVVVATSNTAPDDLYHEGLNRQLFLPFIDLLKARCRVFRLEARTDFRLAKINRGEAYLSPLGSRAETTLGQIWERLSGGKDDETCQLRVKGRIIKPKRAAKAAAWFSFDQLCREARSANDYLAIASRFDTVIIEQVPMMGNAMRNEAKRFVILVDTLYDKKVRAVFSAEANPHALYQGTSGVVAQEFQRTASRLVEMQSQDYLARHKTIKEQG